MIPIYGFSQTPPPVTIDGTLQGLTGSGNNSGFQELQGQDITVTREMGLVKGSNLFHSFGQFNVPTEGSVTFTGPNSIANILSRVTGNNVSNIDGTLASTIDGANFYLMNPQGIIFGPNASLNISGSFYATTANNIELADGAFFNAVPDQQVDALLTSAPPEAFGFLGNNPPNIELNGTIENTATVQIEGLNSNGSDVVVIARDAVTRDNANIVEGVGIKGTILTQGGDVELASVDSPGRALLGSLNIDGFSKQGQVHISGPINTSPEPDSGSGGDVNIYGKEIVAAGILGSTMINTRPGGFFNEAQAGTVNIKATETVFFDTFKIDTGSNFNGGSGGVTITAEQSIDGTNLVVESLNVFSTSDGGSIFLGPTTDESSLSVTIQGGEITTDADGFPGRQGKSATIEIVGNKVSLTGGAQINSRTAGPQGAGNITINSVQEFTISGEDSSGSISTLNSNTSGAGAGGEINISGNNIAFQNGGTASSSTNNIGSAGGITITGEKMVSVSGKSQSGKQSTLATDNTSGMGPAGTVKLMGGEILVTNGGILSSTNRNGQGGNLAIIGSSVIVSDSGTLITTQSLGSQKGGDADIIATNGLIVRNGAQVTATGNSTGEAGNLNFAVSSGDLRIIDSSVNTEASLSNGGNHKYTATGPGSLIFFKNSDVSASVGGGTGGNINLDPEFIILQGSNILATATTGAGGNITLTASTSVLMDPFSTLDASSSLGINGSVNIRAPIQQLSGEIAPLPQTTINVANLYAHRCAAHKAGRFSSFVQRDSNRVPSGGGRFLSSPLLIGYLPTMLITRNNQDDVQINIRQFSLTTEVERAQRPIKSRMNLDVMLGEC